MRLHTHTARLGALSAALACAGLVNTAQAQAIDANARLLAAANQSALASANANFPTVITAITGYSLVPGPVVYQWEKQPELKPMVAEMEEVSNCSDVTQTAPLTFSYSKQTSTSHTFSWGFTEGVKATAKANVPLVGETAIEVSFAANQNTSDTDTKTETKTYASTLQAVAAPHTRQYGQLVVSTGKYNGTFYIDFVAVGPVTYKYKTGEQVSGRWQYVEHEARTDIGNLIPASKRSFRLTGTVAVDNASEGNYSFTNPAPLAATDPVCLPPAQASLGATQVGLMRRSIVTRKLPAPSAPLPHTVQVVAVRPAVTR